MTLTAEQIDTLLSAARQRIRGALAGQPPAIPHAIDPALLQPAGCFISLHVARNHELRGCIGRMDASRPLLEGVVETSVSVLDDPRFVDNPVTLDELPELEIEISVLSPLHPARDPLDFDPLHDGICLTIDGRSGIFLPQVARETGWSKEQLLDRLCTEKLGLPAGVWQLPQAELQTFQTLILGPAPFQISNLKFQI